MRGMGTAVKNAGDRGKWGGVLCAPRTLCTNFVEDYIQAR